MTIVEYIEQVREAAVNDNQQKVAELYSQMQFPRIPLAQVTAREWADARGESQVMLMGAVAKLIAA